MTMPNNTMVYEGEWVQGVIQGYGRIKWASGNIYEGEFKFNKINGNGYLVWYDSLEKYIGQWTDSLQNGIGIHLWYEDKGAMKYLRNRYVGEWRNGFRHGYGVFYYSNGCKYEGTWDQNYKHGFGVYTFYDGSQYVGRFHNDRMIDYNSSGVLVPTTLSRIADNKEKIPTSLNPTGSLSSINSLALNANRENLNSQQGTPIQNPLNTNTFSTKRKPTIAVIKEENEYSPLPGRERKDTATSSQIKEETGRQKYKENKLEEIPEHNESMITGNQNLNKQQMNKNENLLNVTNYSVNTNANNESFINSLNKPKEANNSVVTNRAINSKEGELNQFKTSIDITDIIECEPDIEASLKEVENILLRHLSDMKDWYNKYLIRGKEGKDEFNMTMTNASMLHFENSKVGSNILTNQDKGEENKELSSKNIPDQKNISAMDGIYNNDLGFCLELKDMWRFLRDSNILTSEFTLAQFNRIFFKGPKNYIEMFYCPEDLEKQQIYDYIYLMVGKAKEEFFSKYKYNVDKNLKRNESGDFVLNNQTPNGNFILI
jgi:hypothetical protein